MRWKTSCVVLSRWFVDVCDRVFCVLSQRLSSSCNLFFFLMIRRPPRSTLDRSSAASDVYKRQGRGFGYPITVGERPLPEHMVKPGGRYLFFINVRACLLYTSPSPRDRTRSRMPSSAWKKNKPGTLYHITSTAISFIHTCHLYTAASSPFNGQ
mgnify:CR=1 FL=1